MSFQSNLKSLIHRLPFIGGVSSILVCETDGFYLSGTVISQQGSALKVDYSAKSEAIEYTEAVKAVLASLRGQGWQGNQAVLLTPAVFSALIELPLSPKQPRHPLQMQELVRWELEPLLMQYSAMWSIGQVLLTLGHITEAQVVEVLEHQQGKNKKNIGGVGDVYSFKRYGELAIEMGCINQTQLDEAIARQAWLRADSDEIACGWAAQMPIDSNDFTKQGDNASYPWLASAINTGVLHQWESAFATHRVILSDVFPLTGCAIDCISAQQDLILLETSNSIVAGTRLKSGSLDAIESHKKSSHTALESCLEIYHNLVTPETRQVWLAASGDSAKMLTQSLSEMIGREVQLVSTLNTEVSAGIKSVAAQLLSANLSSHFAGVSVRGPQPSLFKRVEVRAIAAGLLFVFILGAAEASLFIRNQLAQAEHTKTAFAKKEFDAVVAKAQAKVDAVNKLKDEIKVKSEELTKLNAQYDFFAVELAMRTRFVRSFFNDLESSVSEDVVINGIDETPNLGIKVTAWAISEKAAQQFIQSLKNALASLGMNLLDPVVRSQTGRLGLMGYTINFRLTEMSEPAVNAQAIASKSSAGKNIKK